MLWLYPLFWFKAKAMGYMGSQVSSLAKYIIINPNFRGQIKS
jgi:hypothetical protein